MQIPEGPENPFEGSFGSQGLIMAFDFGQQFLSMQFEASHVGAGQTFHFSAHCPSAVTKQVPEGPLVPFEESLGSHSRIGALDLGQQLLETQFEASQFEGH